MKRCDVRVCNMISICFMQIFQFSLLDRRFDSFFFTTMKHKEKIYVLNNKDTSDAHVYAYMRVYLYAYVRIGIRVCAYAHTRMCVYSYAYVRIIRVCAVNVYLSGTVLCDQLI